MNTHHQMINEGARATMTRPISGSMLNIGSGFTAHSFRAREVGTAMDPLVMVDHYVMTEPTFGAHPHAGMSALSLLFEDTTGQFHNRDSLGNDFDLQPGDLFWLKAGSGALHDEAPRPGSRIHGLQVFVNVPQVERFDAPDSLLVRAQAMPVLAAKGYRVRVAIGASNGVVGAKSPSIPMTVLDGLVNPRASFVHRVADRRGVWVHAIAGDIEVMLDDKEHRLSNGQALAIRTTAATQLTIMNRSASQTQFALLEGQRIDEPFVQEGPFVMGSHAQIKEIKSAYETGLLASLPPSF